MHEFLEIMDEGSDDANLIGQGPYVMDESFLFESDVDMLSHTGSGSNASTATGEKTPPRDDDWNSFCRPFDWTEATPGRGWTPQSLSMSQQSGASWSSDVSSCVSSPSSKGTSTRSRVPGNPAALQVASLEAALGATCGCRRGPNDKFCMEGFNIGDVFRLRYERSRLTGTEDSERRKQDLQRALSNGTKHCRIVVEGRPLCLQAYCMLFNINWASMRRSWSQLTQGTRVQGRGRPKGSSSEICSSTRGMEAYAWLKAWIEVFEDQDPVGTVYKFVVNYISVADLHEQYCRDLEASQVGAGAKALSARAFARVWSQFKREEKVRVRRKANTTTKCQG